MKNKETLEEAALRLHPRLINDSYNPMEDSNEDDRNIWIKGAKWQQERSYSEEEILNILYKHTEDMLAGKKVTLEQWFNEFKKK